jgi:hypothetical protein
MRKYLILLAIAWLACVLVIALAASAPAGRGDLARVLDCVHSAGLSATVFHDSGLRPVSADDADVALLMGGSNGMVRVADPSDRITVFGSDATTIAVIRLPEGGAIAFRPGPHLPRHDRITLAACVASR